MSRYFIEYSDGDEWHCNHLETPTPTTWIAAADLLLYVQAEYNLADRCRVTMLRGAHALDVTISIMRFIEQRKAEAEREAAEDEAHERQERHGFEQV